MRVGTIESAGFEDDEFDLVAMMDVLEHTDGPERMVAEASRVLRPGGVVTVLTPDAGSMITRLMGSRWPEARRTDHLVLFSVRGVSELLRRHRLEPVDWHWIGKRSSVATLVADASPAAPRLGAVRAVADRAPPRGSAPHRDQSAVEVLPLRAGRAGGRMSASASPPGPVRGRGGRGAVRRRGRHRPAALARGRVGPARLHRRQPFLPRLDKGDARARVVPEQPGPRLPAGIGVARLPGARGRHGCTC